MKRILLIVLAIAITLTLTLTSTAAMAKVRHYNATGCSDPSLPSAPGWCWQ
ncbi:MAG TPA: hypothetical protein VNT26_16130 [Candidatus Sulfotelmatobacter sp.]|nr:hypothetical protein [Candidatus Sulfotelmatobacter sp.]